MATAATGYVQACCFCFLCLSRFVVPLLAVSCTYKDECTCEMSDGSGLVSLWEIDGGSAGPSFKNVPYITSQGFDMSWNPCTSFSQPREGCTNVKICQRETSQNPNLYFPVSEKVDSFRVKNGDVVITYKKIRYKGYDRTGVITLKCDKTKVGKVGLGIGFSETANHFYTATLKNKCACPGACKDPHLANTLSIGSILLIVFFVLIVVYLVGGILINKFGRHVESIPEVIPNLSFWKDLPFLIKDGCVLTFTKLKSFFRGRSNDYEKL